MTTYLIRHTTPGIAPGICYGQTDIPLTGSFSKEFRSIRKKLKHVKEGIIISSPLQRCSILGQKLAQKMDILWRESEALKEMDFGDWEQKNWDEIEREAFDSWHKDFVHHPVPGGESFYMLSQRVRKFYEELSLETFENIILVTHAGPIRAILSLLLEMPLHKTFALKVPYGAVIRINSITKDMNEIAFVL